MSATTTPGAPLAESHADRFIATLDALAITDNRAALAALRRGLGKPPGTVMEMHPWVVPWLPAHAGRWEEDAYFLIASLYAWHPRHWHAAAGEGHERPHNNLGASFRQMAEAGNRESVERRFVALLNCHPDNLPDHLQAAISLLRSHEVAVNYSLLLGDIANWGRDDRRVQRAWARAFWGAGHEPAGPPANP